MTMKTTETTEQQAPAPVQCSDLLACPFCGGLPQYRTTPDGGHFVDCDGCQASSKLVYPDKTDPKPLVREAWNSRDDHAPAIGSKWKTNSSLEEWFPMTAERMELLEAKVRACGDIAALMVKLGQVSKHWREAAEDYRKRAREWATGDPMHEQRSAVADMLENCANTLDATVQANNSYTNNCSYFQMGLWNNQDAPSKDGGSHS